MNFICQSCGEEIEDSRYAMPFDNSDNVCHIECLEDWFNMNLIDVIYAVTVYYN